MVQSMTGSALLERERELGLLQRAWREAIAGRGSAWLVCAEAGGGKSRLLREACRGLPLRRGAAEPVVPPDPYLAVMQALRGFRPAPQRAESVTRAVEVLERLAGDGPVAVILDDLHFADEGTIAVFVRLATLAEARPWLILGALRPGEGSEALRLAATELVGQGHAERLDLPPLSRAGVATLIAGVRGGPAGADEVDAIFADSGGNPWFAEALARGAGAISTARDRILLRLDRLERAIPGSAKLLAGLAPAGEPVPHIVVATLCAGEVPGLRRVLAGLRDAAVLRESENAWQFRHELLRRSLLEAMLETDRRDAHRRLAEVLEACRESGVGSRESGEALHTILDSRLPTPFRRHVSAAEIAMHYAAAGDERAGEWALRAASEARAVDAHAEALAQLERALAFPLETETRRIALHEAAQAAWYLGRFHDSLRFAEEGLVLPGGEPEMISQLHQRAADCARVLGQTRAAVGHIQAAERLLEGRPVSVQMVRLATSRAWEAAARTQPEQAVIEAERAIRLARTLDDREAGARYELAARCYFGLSLLDAGDPAGFAPFEERISFGTENAEIAREAVPQVLNAYSYAVRSLFHAEADHFRRWLMAGIERHHLEWEARAGPYHVLELVQRGAFAEARSHLETLAPPPSGTMDGTIWLLARVLHEARAGSPTRARALLAAARPPGAFAHTAVLELARIELDSMAGDAGVAASPVELYAGAEGRRFARVAGTAAVAMARAGKNAPPRPDWLAGTSPLGVFWDWADGVAARDSATLRVVAARLEEMCCPYEAALALRDADDLQNAYQALRRLGATWAREDVARLLRATGRSIPRGPRAGADRELTDTERAVCRLVASGATNATVAARLSIGVRTVEAHLSHIYEKTGQRGRVALVSWWREHRSGEGEPTALG